MQHPCTPLQAPYSDVLQDLGATVIGPLVVGQIIQYLRPMWVAWLQVRAEEMQACSCSWQRWLLLGGGLVGRA